MAKTKQTKNNVHSAVFSCRAENANAIFLAGTFNHWNPNATAMQRSSGDEWTVALELPPGSYEYKFVVDGEWCCQVGSDGGENADCVPNAFGTHNRRVAVA